MRLVPITAAVSILASTAAAAEQQVDPLGFFEGRTENHSTVKVLFKKSYQTNTIGQGRIQPDGSLVLVQRVLQKGKPAKERRWRVREVAPGHYTATMSEAVGPVTIDKVGNRYRFRFKMKGNLSVEQWLTPLPGGKSARTSMKVRRFGAVVATTEGLIRKSPS